MALELTDTGLVIQSLAEIKSEVEEALRVSFGPQINLQPQSVFGQNVGISSERESIIQELAEDIYNSQYPDSASGISLDNVLSITGLVRLAALASRITGQALFGTATTVIPAGTQFSINGDPDKVFSSDTEITLIAGTDEVQDITFSTTPTGGSFKLDYDGEITAAILFSGGSAEVQAALRALTNTSTTGITVSGSFVAGFTIIFAGDDGKQEQPILLENSNTLTNGGAVTISIAETTPGVYQGQVNCTALDTGPTSVAKKALSVIDNPISGLTRVFNPAVATIGRDLETDAEAKIRRGQRLQISVAGPTAAIDNKIFELNDEIDKTTIEYAHTFENITLITDSRGIPGKAFEVFVYLTAGATDRDQEIAQAIFDSKPAGIESHGDISKTVQDSEGLDHTIKFSRPTAVPIYLILDLTVTSAYPSDGDTQVEDIMVVWGGGLGVGQDVIVFPSLVAQLDAVPGITDVIVKIGIAPTPTLDNNIVIDDGITPGVVVELSTWDAANITVNS
jgi:uncharacterized phage protein gp47/JayE